LDLTDKRFSIECEQLVVFVVSTTGEGEAPDNAKKFWRRISKPTIASNFLSTEVGVEPWVYNLIPYILHQLGLYDIQRIPKVLVQKIENKMSDEHSLLNSSPQLSELTELSLPLVTKKSQQIVVQKCEEVQCCDEFFFAKLPVMNSKLFDAKLMSMRRLNKLCDSDSSIDIKSVFEATMESDTCDFPEYAAGDSFGFICGNRDEEVSLIMKLLNCDNDANEFYSISCEGINHLPQYCKLRDYFKYYCELRSVPMKSCIRCFADFCESDIQKRRMLELSSREGADDYAKFVRGGSLNMLDLLQMFDSCKPTLEAFFSNVPCFVPRYYSVVNTQCEEKKGLFRFAFSVLEFESRFKREATQLKGVFTGLLESLFKTTDETYSIGDCRSPIASFKVFKRKNLHFKLPKSPSAPLILVGPGTGVAPFIAFLEERQKMKENGQTIGECWLFFGCRHSLYDFIYERELHDFQHSNVLTNLCVCFSRDDSHPQKYVQNLIEENGKAISQLILKNNETVVYVCGDLQKLSVNVSTAFTNVIEVEDNLIREDAVKIIRDLQSAKRYLQDVWV
ncbi:hypothetical protein B4U80_02626, partial [Leptotrombidium deliense]